MAARTPIPAAQLAWLQREAERWRADGLIGDDTAAAIVGRYESGARRSVVRLLVGLGAGLLAVGLLWLVAANVDLDRVGPLARVLAVAVVWLACAAGALRGRRRPWGGAAALGAAAAFGATVFVAANVLQVPAYAPGLAGAWAAGALAQAYASRSRTTLVLALGLGVGWWTWELATRGDDGTGVVLGLALAAPLLVLVAALSDATGRSDSRGAHLPSPPDFAGPWRAAGLLLALAAAFGAALPDVLAGGEPPTVAWVAVALLAAATAAVAPRLDPAARTEVLVALAAAGAGLLLSVLAPSTATDVFSGERPPAGQLAHTLVACALVLALAVFTALEGARRDAPALTNLAVATLVLLVVVQSFGLLAPLLSGAGLALTVGAVLVGCGLAAERARRRLADLPPPEARPADVAHVPNAQRREHRPRARLWLPALTPVAAALLALALQVTLLAAVAGPRTAIRVTGDELRVLVEPVDPIDPFRGAYVDLRLRGLGVSPTAGDGTLYVPLRPRGDVLVAGDAQPTRPATGRFLRCTGDGGRGARCGIESFFASQAEARRLERDLADGAVARLRVDGDGDAVLVGLGAG